MTDQQVFEILYPEPHALTDSARASMRADLFGATPASLDRLASGEDRPVDPATDAMNGVELTPRANNGPLDVGTGRRWLRAAAAVVLIAGIAGIWAASTRVGDDAPAAARQTTTASSPSGDPPLGPNVLTDLERRAVELGYTEQAEILARGYVAEDDLLTAIDNARRCVRDHGFEVGPIVQDSRGSMSYDFTLPEGADTPENLALADECQFRYSILVEEAFNRLHPSDAQAVIARVIACVAQDSDETSPFVDTFPDLQAAVDAAPGSALESCYLSILSEQTIVAK